MIDGAYEPEEDLSYPGWCEAFEHTQNEINRRFAKKASSSNRESSHKGKAPPPLTAEWANNPCVLKEYFGEETSYPIGILPLDTLKTLVSEAKAFRSLASSNEPDSHKAEVAQVTRGLDALVRLNFLDPSSDVYRDAFSLYADSFDPLVRTAPETRAAIDRKASSLERSFQTSLQEGWLFRESRQVFANSEANRNFGKRKPRSSFDPRTISTAKVCDGNRLSRVRNTALAVVQENRSLKYRLGVLSSAAYSQEIKIAALRKELKFSQNYTALIAGQQARVTQMLDDYAKQVQLSALAFSRLSDVHRELQARMALLPPAAMEALYSLSPKQVSEALDQNHWLVPDRSLDPKYSVAPRPELGSSRRLTELDIKLERVKEEAMTRSLNATHGLEGAQQRSGGSIVHPPPLEMYQLTYTGAMAGASNAMLAAIGDIPKDSPTDPGWLPQPAETFTQHAAAGTSGLALASQNAALTAQWLKEQPTASSEALKQALGLESGLEKQPLTMFKRALVLANKVRAETKALAADSPNPVDAAAPDIGDIAFVDTTGDDQGMVAKEPLPSDKKRKRTEATPSPKVSNQKPQAEVQTKRAKNQATSKGTAGVPPPKERAAYPTKEARSAHAVKFTSRRGKDKPVVAQRMVASVFSKLPMKEVMQSDCNFFKEHPHLTGIRERFSVAFDVAKNPCLSTFYLPSPDDDGKTRAVQLLDLETGLPTLQNKGYAAHYVAQPALKLGTTDQTGDHSVIYRLEGRYDGGPDNCWNLAITDEMSSGVISMNPFDRLASAQMVEATPCLSEHGVFITSAKAQEFSTNHPARFEVNPHKVHTFPTEAYVIKYRVPPKEPRKHQLKKQLTKPKKERGFLTSGLRRSTMLGSTAWLVKRVPENPDAVMLPVCQIPHVSVKVPKVEFALMVTTAKHLPDFDYSILNFQHTLKDLVPEDKIPQSWLDSPDHSMVLWQGWPDLLDDSGQIIDAPPEQALSVFFPVIPLIKGYSNKWEEWTLTKKEARPVCDFLRKEISSLKTVMERQVHQVYYDILFCFRSVLHTLDITLRKKPTETAAVPASDPNDSDSSIDGADQDLAAEPK